MATSTPVLPLDTVKAAAYATSLYRQLLEETESALVALAADDTHALAHALGRRAVLLDELLPMLAGYGRALDGLAPLAHAVRVAAARLDSAIAATRARWSVSAGGRRR